MVNSTPNPIREYYIAYFDILGYKDFFQATPEKATDFLSLIHNAIQRTNNHIRFANESIIASAYGKINIHVKIFSDNFLLCMETLEETVEPVRVLAFLKIVSDIQRGFVTEFDLFVRGGITRGDLSYNDDYVFGEGLIEAVSMEDTIAKYPRIIVNQKVVDGLFQNRFYSQEEFERAASIETRIKNNESVLEEEKKFHSEILFKMQVLQIHLTYANALLFQWPDGFCVLNYLHQVHSIDMLSQEKQNAFLQVIKQAAPDLFNHILQSTLYLDNAMFEQSDATDEKVLSKHKKIVTEHLLQFGNNQDIVTGDFKAAEQREHKLRKYIWAMAYHNYVCDMYQKPEYKILTKCNCDTRFLKMTIEVLEDEARI